MGSSEKSEWVTGRVTLSVGRRSFDMEMTVPARPLKPHRMLPIFQQITNSFVELSVEAAEAGGSSVSCKAGCGACCRQPVPLAEAEVYHIAELVASLPDETKKIVTERFEKGVSHFTKIGWFAKMKRCAETARDQSEETAMKKVQETVMEYFHEGIPCPFLLDESCSIHKDRPLACREYLVSSPAENCSSPSAEGVRKVPLLIEPSKALRSVGTTGSFAGIGIITLIQALELAEKVPEHFVEKTGERWAADFFGFMTRTEIPKKGVSGSKQSSIRRRKKNRS